MIAAALSLFQSQRAFEKSGVFVKLSGREMTEQTEITEQTKPGRFSTGLFRVFRFFRLFRCARPSLVDLVG